MENTAVSKALSLRFPKPGALSLGAKRSGQRKRSKGRIPKASGEWEGLSGASMGSRAVLGPLVRRDPEEKLMGGLAVGAHQLYPKGLPAALRFHAQSQKVASGLLPRDSFLGSADPRQIVKSSQHGVAAAESSQNSGQPKGDQPGGYQAFRIHLHRGAPKAPLSPLPIAPAQKQGAHDRADRVLKIGDQLYGQERKGSLPLATQKASHGNPLFPELGKKLNGIPPVRANRSITTKAATEGTGGTDPGIKIDLTAQKRFLVFPKALKCVKVGNLNLSGAWHTRGRVFGLRKPSDLPPCVAGCFSRVNFLPRYFAYLYTIGPFILPIPSPQWPRYLGK